MDDWRRAAFGEPPPLFPAAASMMAAQQGMMPTQQSMMPAQQGMMQVLALYHLFDPCSILNTVYTALGGQNSHESPDDRKAEVIAQPG